MKRQWDNPVRVLKILRLSRRLNMDWGRYDDLSTLAVAPESWSQNRGFLDSRLTTMSGSNLADRRSEVIRDCIWRSWSVCGSVQLRADVNGWTVLRWESGDNCSDSQCSGKQFFTFDRHFDLFSMSTLERARPKMWSCKVNTADKLQKKIKTKTPPFII